MTSQPSRTAPMDHKKVPKDHEWVQKNLVFSSDNCNCASKTCWLGWCCSACLLQRNYNRYKLVAKQDQKVDPDAYCGWCCALQCCLMGWAHFGPTTYVRHKIRKARYVKGGWVGDFCSTACCLPCALIQEAHEMEAAMPVKVKHGHH